MKRILVIKLGAFGDFILAQGAFNAIRQHHPEAHITFLTTKPLASLAEKTPYFDRVWAVDRWPLWHLLPWWRFIKQLQAENFSVVYDLQRNRRTHIFKQLASVDLKKVWCDAKHTTKDALNLSDLGAPSAADLSWMDADISRFNIKSPFVLLVPGCSPRHPKKRWPVENYAAVAQQLHQKGFAAVV